MSFMFIVGRPNGLGTIEFTKDMWRVVLGPFALWVCFYDFETHLIAWHKKFGKLKDGDSSNESARILELLHEIGNLKNKIKLYEYLENNSAAGNPSDSQCATTREE